VWAEQAAVFPDWHTYSAQLSERAALASRHWLDSIGLPNKKKQERQEKQPDDALQAQGAQQLRQQWQRAAGARAGVLKKSGWLRRVMSGLSVQ
jgi:hypothetical protein